jgi:hypothetical protein
MMVRVFNELTQGKQTAPAGIFHTRNLLRDFFAMCEVGGCVASCVLALPGFGRVRNAAREAVDVESHAVDRRSSKRGGREPLGTSIDDAVAGRRSVVGAMIASAWPDPNRCFSESARR